MPDNFSNVGVVGVFYVNRFGNGKVLYRFMGSSYRISSVFFTLKLAVYNACVIANFPIEIARAKLNPVAYHR